MKELIAAAILTLSLANVSAPYNFPTVAQTAPREDFALIGMYDIKPTRESIQTLREAEEAAAVNYESTKPEELVKQVESGPKTMTVLATAYCKCAQCCGKDDGITATGTHATEGRTIAADPRLLPYGTHVLIDGHEYVVEDCGGDIQNQRIDVFFASHSAANAFGRHYVTLEVLG